MVEGRGESSQRVFSYSNLFRFSFEELVVGGLLLSLLLYNNIFAIIRTRRGFVSTLVQPMDNRKAIRIVRSRRVAHLIGNAGPCRAMTNKGSGLSNKRTAAIISPSKAIMHGVGTANCQVRICTKNGSQASHRRTRRVTKGMGRLFNGLTVCARFRDPH